MTVRPTLPANHVDGDIVTATEWNLAVVQQGNWAQEVIAGTNSDKIPASGITGAVGYYPNILVNGGFEINQKFGTNAGSATSTASMAVDRWMAQVTGAATLGWQTTATNADAGSSFSENLVYTHAASQAGLFYQSVENFAEFRGKTVYLTVRCLASSTGMYAYIQDSAATSATVRSIGDGVYHTITTSLTVNAATTFLYVKIAFDATCNVYVDNVMLAMAPAPIDYIQRPKGEEALLCRRYYQTVKSTARWRTQVVSETRDVNVPYPVAMAGTPVATLTTTGTRTNITSFSMLSVATDSMRTEYVGTAATTDTSSIADAISLQYDVP
jgi:hypothetical protein